MRFECALTGDIYSFIYFFLAPPVLNSRGLKIKQRNRTCLELFIIIIYLFIRYNSSSKAHKTTDKSNGIKAHTHKHKTQKDRKYTGKLYNNKVLHREQRKLTQMHNY